MTGLRAWRGWVPLAVAGPTLLAYAGSLGNGFHYDDESDPELSDLARQRLGRLRRRMAK